MGFCVNGYALGRKLFLACSILSTSPAWAWGGSGHMIVNRAAVELMTSKDKAFFAANADLLAAFAKTPDALWKQKATYAKERPMHFFQWDNYEKSKLESLFPIELSKAIATVGPAFIDENGTAPWRAAQIYTKLKTALAAKDCAAAIQMAGVLGHYVGDLSQPMHNSSDYDGQSIQKPGVHKYFETTLVEKQDQAVLLGAVIKAGAASFPEMEFVSFAGQPLDVVKASVQESKVALEDLAGLLADLKQNPVNDQGLIDQLAPLMGHGSHVLAKIWDMAANAAGTQSETIDATGHCPAKALTGVQPPAWFALITP